MRKSIKAYVAGFLTCLMIASTVAWAATGGGVMREVFFGVRVVLDGVEQGFAEDAQPFIMDGRTYLPARCIAEAFGIPIEWDGDTSTVYIGHRPMQGFLPGGPPLTATTREHLDVAVSGLPFSISPGVSNDTSSSLVIAQIFDTFLNLDYDTMEVLPGLAIAWDMPDAQTVNMELRRDVVFHDGQPLIASDVAFSLERASTMVGAMMFSYMIDSVTIHDDYNFTIHLWGPHAPILRNLTHPMMSIVPMGHFTNAWEENFENHPIGTGPFMFEELVIGDYLQLTRNMNYWGNLSQVETIRFHTIPDASSRIIAIKVGEVDIALAVAPADVATANTFDNVTLLRGPNLFIDYIGFNMQKEPFNNPLVAQAINYAIDVQEIIDIAFHGVGTPATSPLSSLAWGYADVEPFEFNPERARELLTLAGYPDGFETTIWWNIPNMQRADIADIVQRRLLDVGIDVTVEGLEWATVLEGTDWGDHDMFIMAWVALSGDADYGLFPTFHSFNFGAAGNRTHTANPELDRLLEAGREAIDPVERAAIYSEILQLLREHPSMVPIRQGENLVAVSNDLHGLTLDPIGNHRFAEVYFAD